MAALGARPRGADALRGARRACGRRAVASNHDRHQSAHQHAWADRRAGEGAEGPTIDYKGDADPAEWWELAKDIAAFANHLGGVIVVGAYEPDGLPSIQGLPPEKMRALANAYENVAKERCRPSPLVTCEKIPWSDGREVLAVNVQPHASGLVGARFYALNAKGEKIAANAWQFVTVRPSPS